VFIENFIGPYYLTSISGLDILLSGGDTFMSKGSVVNMSYEECLEVLMVETGEMLFCFNRAIQYTEVLTELAASGDRAGTERELEILCLKNPDLPKRLNIVALGEPIKDSDQREYAAARILGGKAVFLPLSGRIGRGWNKKDHFLAFHM